MSTIISPTIINTVHVLLSSNIAATLVTIGLVLPLLFYTVFYFLHLRSSAIKDLKKEECLVLITGCDTGFGHMLALALTARGYPVVATCYTTAGIKALEAQNVFRVLQCDVTKLEDLQQVEKIVDTLIDDSRAGSLLSSPGGSNSGKHQSNPSNQGSPRSQGPRYKLWAVVNNAGIAPTGFVDWLPISAARQVMEVNYFAIIQVIQTMLPLLKTVRNSRIINVSSAAGFSGFPGGGYYCGSKHAVEGLMKCLRQELIGWNIHVCNVNPGFMK